jgi:hypothetical protein
VTRVHSYKGQTGEAGFNIFGVRWHRGVVVRWSAKSLASRPSSSSIALHFVQIEGSLPRRSEIDWNIFPLCIIYKSSILSSLPTHIPSDDLPPCTSSTFTASPSIAQWGPLSPPRWPCVHLLYQLCRSAPSSRVDLILNISGLRVRRTVVAGPS